MSFDNEKSIEVVKIDKNGRGDCIVVNKIIENDEFKCIDIRQYFTNDNDELCPTKKGIRIPARMLDQLKESLNSMEV